MNTQSSNDRNKIKEIKNSILIRKLHQKGKISDAAVLIFGISGIMPDIIKYNSMSTEEKNNIWRERMERKFGSDWIEKFENRNIPLPIVVDNLEKNNINNWAEDGF